MHIVRSDLGQRNGDERLDQDFWVRHAVAGELEHVVVEERKIDVDRPRRILSRGFRTRASRRSTDEMACS